MRSVRFECSLLVIKSPRTLRHRDGWCSGASTIALKCRAQIGPEDIGTLRGGLQHQIVQSPTADVRSCPLFPNLHERDGAQYREISQPRSHVSIAPGIAEDEDIVGSLRKRQ